jgi:hypothetical protein
MRLVVIDVATAGFPTQATEILLVYQADSSKLETRSRQTPIFSGSKKMHHVPPYLSPAANLQIHLTWQIKRSGTLSLFLAAETVEHDT